jgi:CheY-like chemotaxis protein
MRSRALVKGVDPAVLRIQAGTLPCSGGFRVKPPDVYLLDIGLSAMDGNELSK